MNHDLSYALLAGLTRKAMSRKGWVFNGSDDELIDSENPRTIGARRETEAFFYDVMDELAAAGRLAPTPGAVPSGGEGALDELDTLLAARKKAVDAVREAAEGHEGVYMSRGVAKTLLKGWDALPDLLRRLRAGAVTSPGVGGAGRIDLDLVYRAKQHLLDDDEPSYARAIETLVNDWQVLKQKDLTARPSASVGGEGAAPAEGDGGLADLQHLYDYFRESGKYDALRYLLLAGQCAGFFNQLCEDDNEWFEGQPATVALPESLKRLAAATPPVAPVAGAELAGLLSNAIKELIIYSQPLAGRAADRVDSLIADLKKAHAGLAANTNATEGPAA